MWRTDGGDSAPSPGDLQRANPRSHELQGAELHPQLLPVPRLNFLDLMGALPPHLADPMPNYLVRAWFQKAVQPGAARDGYVRTEHLLDCWSVAIAPRKHVIDRALAQHDTRGTGELTEAQFTTAAASVGYGAESAARLFQELAALERELLKISHASVMARVAQRGCSEGMKLFLVAMACPPPRPKYNTKRWLAKRRVWRPGPRPTPPPTVTSTLRKQLLADKHGTERSAAMYGQSTAARASWEERLELRMLKQAARDASVTRKAEDDMDRLDAQLNAVGALMSEEARLNSLDRATLMRLVATMTPLSKNCDASVALHRLIRARSIGRSSAKCSERMSSSSSSVTGIAAAAAFAPLFLLLWHRHKVRGSAANTNLRRPPGPHLLQDRPSRRPRPRAAAPRPAAAAAAEF